MAMTRVQIDCRRIKDESSLHDVFKETLGFSDFYGRNMDAWNDCMGDLDDPDTGMTKIHAPPGGIVVLELDHVTDFSRRCPELYRALVECSAFVNYAKLEVGEPAVLALSFFMGDPEEA